MMKAGNPAGSVLSMERVIKESQRAPVAILLLAVGALALLGQAGLVQGMGNFVGAALFGAIGYYLLRERNRGSRDLGRLIGGYALYALAAAALLDTFSGAAFFGVLAYGFYLAYRERRSRMWALITAGTLLVIGVTSLAGSVFMPFSGSVIFFFGLAALFWYLYTPGGYGQAWAFYPAVALAAIGLLNLLVGGGWLLPLLLIGGGFYLLSRREEKQA